jgi:uncharacterized protein (DUF433 family)
MGTRKTKLIEKRTGAGGEATYIAGSRVRVADIVCMIPFVETDDVVQSLVESLPTLSEDRVRAAIDYWLTHKTEIDFEIKEEEAIFEQHRASSSAPQTVVSPS